MRNYAWEKKINDDNLGPELLCSEFDTALSLLRRGDATGINNIIIELVKNSYDLILDELYKITAHIYWTGEIPVDYLTENY